MRKTTIATIVIAILIGLGVWAVLAGPVNPDNRLVRNLSTQFMEDLQFKDFRRSSSYHHELEKDRVDIGNTLEKLFLVKPESLDIREYRIVKSELDSTGKRARVHIRTKFQRLNMKEEPEEGELILYWMLRHPNCPIGATCDAGKCTNEEGEKLYLDPSKDRPISQPEYDDMVADEDTKKDDLPDAITCDPEAEPRWFMNLDSTLKEKRYNY